MRAEYVFHIDNGGVKAKTSPTAAMEMRSETGGKRMMSVVRAAAQTPTEAMRATRIMLALAWLACTSCAGAEPLNATQLDLAGVQLDMTPETVSVALARQSGATPAIIIRRPDSRREQAGQTYVQRSIQDLRDGRNLQVVFSDPASGNRAVEITLADPHAQDITAVRAEAERLYGPPAAMLPIDQGRGFIAAWNGTAETQGTIRPLPGAAATLRLEFAPGPGSNLRLTGHTEISPVESPASARRPAQPPGG
jgi:hypothetical protein